MDLISVIIPIYNQGQYLARCLDSVLAQTYKDLEIILVNDGSTDNSKEIIDLYKTKDNRIKIIEQENKGLASARNAGIKLSTGKYIAFLDSDDYVEKDIYEVLYNDISKGYDIACIGVEIFNDKGHLGYFNDNQNEVYKLKMIEALHYHVVSENKFISTSSCDKLFKREIVLSKLFSDGNYYEDLRNIAYYISQSKKVIYRSKAYYHYYYNSKSLTHGKFNPKWYTWIEANEERIKVYEEHDPEDLPLINAIYVDNVLSIIYKSRKDKENKVKREEIMQSFKIFLSANKELPLSKKCKNKLRLYKINKHLFYFAMHMYDLLLRK